MSADNAIYIREMPDGTFHVKENGFSQVSCMSRTELDEEFGLPPFEKCNNLDEAGAWADEEADRYYEDETPLEYGVIVLLRKHDRMDVSPEAMQEARNLWASLMNSAWSMSDEEYREAWAKTSQKVKEILGAGYPED